MLHAFHHVTLAAPDSPGPAEYQDAEYLPGGPAFTMGARPIQREETTDSPAPGDYVSKGSRMILFSGKH